MRPGFLVGRHGDAAPGAYRQRLLARDRHIPASSYEEHRSRSELVREAIRLYIDVRRRRLRPADNPRVQQAVAVQDALSRAAPGSGEDDSTLDVRRWREARS